MSQVTPEEAEILSHENLFLKKTILALRDELIKKDQEKDTFHQKNLLVLDNENSSLKETVEELRLELEERMARADDEIQKEKLSML